MKSHAFASGKRGDLLSLSLARLEALAPGFRRTALSATVAEPELFRSWLAPGGEAALVDLVEGEEGARPDVAILLPDGERVPWSGHAASWAVPQLYAQIRNTAPRWCSPIPVSGGIYLPTAVGR